MACRKRFASIYRTKQLIGFLLLFIIANTVIAQGSNRNLQIELVTETFEGDALLHIRLPRGQSIEEAYLSQDDITIALEPDLIPLPITQFIILDASNEMVNLQSVVQSNISRFWRNTEHLTSLIIFDDDVENLQPTNRSDTLDDFLVNYSAMPGSPACLGQALDIINDTQRDFDRTWRILLVTAGDFSRQASCTNPDLATLPAPVDVIAITDTLDPNLQDLVDRSGGQFFTANLRSVEARTNEVLSQWGQPSYTLSGALPEAWDSNSPFELEVLISTGIEETIILNFLDYNVPTPIVSTPEISTISPTATLIIEATTINNSVSVSTAIPTDIPDSDLPPQTNASDNVAILLIIGAVLFVVGAIVLALALSRVRRTPDERTSTKLNFYQTLDTSEENESQVEQNTLSSDEPITQLHRDDDQDNLLVTQVLSDVRFQNMMSQSRSNVEIIGWIRLVSKDINRDFELTRRGAVIGRSQECDIQITGDGAISRKHARLDVSATNQVTISRLSAVNPVLISGIQINNRHPLAANDVIHLSDETRLIFIAKVEPDEFDDDDTNQF